MSCPSTTPESAMARMTFSYCLLASSRCSLSVPSSFVVPMNSPSPRTNSGMASNSSDALSTASMVALSDAKTWTGNAFHRQVVMYETKGRLSTTACVNRQLSPQHRSWRENSVPYEPDGRPVPLFGRRCSPSWRWRRALAPWEHRATPPSSSFRHHRPMRRSPDGSRWLSRAPCRSRRWPRRFSYAGHH